MGRNHLKGPYRRPLQRPNGRHRLQLLTHSQMAGGFGFVADVVDGGKYLWITENSPLLTGDVLGEPEASMHRLGVPEKPTGRRNWPDKVKDGLLLRRLFSAASVANVAHWRGKARLFCLRSLRKNWIYSNRLLVWSRRPLKCFQQRLSARQSLGRPFPTTYLILSPCPRPIAVARMIFRSSGIVRKAR